VLNQALALDDLRDDGYLLTNSGRRIDNLGVPRFRYGQNA
jgi:hypothetical protein